jgi:hypothetical protein
LHFLVLVEAPRGQRGRRFPKAAPDDRRKRKLNDALPHENFQPFFHSFFHPSQLLSRVHKNQKISDADDSLRDSPPDASYICVEEVLYKCTRRVSLSEGAEAAQGGKVEVKYWLRLIDLRRESASWSVTDITKIMELECTAPFVYHILRNLLDFRVWLQELRNQS